jgi:hypothetical protein
MPVIGPDSYAEFNAKSSFNILYLPIIAWTDINNTMEEGILV